MENIPNNSDKKSEAPKKPRKIKRIYEGLTEDEFIKLLNVTKKLHHKLAFILGYGSGLRVSEIIKLQPADVDFKAGKIFVRMGKGSKDRIVNIPKQFKEKYLSVLPIDISVRALEAIFLRNSLKAGINRIIGYYDAKGKNMPLYRLRVHSLRHSYAIRALELGVPINQLQILLGHENLATTSKYTKANPHDAIQSIIDKGV